MLQFTFRRVYTAFASTHALLTRFFVCDHCMLAYHHISVINFPLVSELVPTAEEVRVFLHNRVSSYDAFTPSGR